VVAENPARLLRQLERIHHDFGDGVSSEKLGLLRHLERRRLHASGEVFRLHELLCFLRAYPDNELVLKRVEQMLADFVRRSDLRRHANALEDTGIAGTTIFYAFYWSTARWLVRNWPDNLTINWSKFKNTRKLDQVLTTLVPYGETLALDEADLTTEEWIDLLKGAEETDAAFVLRRVAKMKGDDFTREMIHEDLNIPLRLGPGPDTPSRTRAKHRRSPVVFQARPLDRSRPSLRAEALRPPLSVRAVSPREGRRLIDLTREAMITRDRDLYAFRNADPNDVRLVECGDGLQFAALGVVPERRLMLDCVYGFLTLKNGVPIGYVLSSAFFNSVEVAYNVFETFRGAEAARVYGRAMGMMRHLFNADAFTIDPYQLGDENMEALNSGAWWFYYKLGYRPEDSRVKRVLAQELRKMRKDPGHRSDIATLRQLASKNVFYYLAKPRRDIRGRIPFDRIGVWVSRYIAKRFGSDREAATRTCCREAVRLLGVRSPGKWPVGERMAWERWSPLMISLPGIERWPAADRRALARIARAKGRRRESDYVLLLDRHKRLRRALLRIARNTHRA